MFNIIFFKFCVGMRYRKLISELCRGKAYDVWSRTSQQMSEEHDRHMTAIDLQLHRIWQRAESCDGCRMFDDVRDRGNIDFGDGEQGDDDDGGGKTDRDRRFMSEAATNRNLSVGYGGRKKRRA